MSENDKKRAPAIHRGGDHTAPYPVSRLAPAFELVDLAKEIEAADATLASHATGKLKLIAEQIRQLQDAARAILEETRLSQELHRAECHFRRQPGRIYHLYRRPDGRAYFSMLAPEEWGSAPPHEYAGSYRLEADMSWTPLEAIGEDDAEREVQRLLAQLDPPAAD